MTSAARWRRAWRQARIDVKRPAWPRSRYFPMPNPPGIGLAHGALFARKAPERYQPKRYAYRVFDLDDDIPF